MIDKVLQTLAKDNNYLITIYDGEYNHYVIEIVNPYGEILSAGMGRTLDLAIEDGLKEMEEDDR